MSAIQTFSTLLHSPVGAETEASERGGGPTRAAAQSKDERWGDMLEQELLSPSELLSDEIRSCGWCISW